MTDTPIPLQQEAEQWWNSIGKFIPHQDSTTRRGRLGYSGCHDAALAGYKAAVESREERLTQAERFLREMTVPVTMDYLDAWRFAVERFLGTPSGQERQ